MKASRHNGRYGKHGTYDVKHNDRNFNISNSDHIDEKRIKSNIYWDRYQGTSSEMRRKDRQFTFSEVEKMFYEERYGDYLEAQNERHRNNRQYNRIRSIDDILKNNKTCPEESIIQLGNIDEHVKFAELVNVALEFFNEFDKKYGSHIHILDWAIHMDEGTPHIHERHVFDAKNRYGEICPQQDKALEELGFELPNPNKPKGKYNNRKMTFDAECRKMFLRICHEKGLNIESEAVYGGASYLEKQDYIIEKQRKKIEEQKIKLDDLEMKIDDVEELLSDMATTAYDKACDVITNEIKDNTIKENIKLIEDYREECISPKHTGTAKDKKLAEYVLNRVIEKLRKNIGKVTKRMVNALSTPEVRQKKEEEIIEHTRISFKDKLAVMTEKANEYNSHNKEVEKKRSRDLLT